MSDCWDLIVIGGGAAGFFAATTFAESSSPTTKVLILEKTPRVLGKVKISGGGRCNLTHACFDAKKLAQHYPRGHKSLIGPFHRWSAEDTIQWFEDRNTPLKTEPDGRVFPCSDDSQSIIDTLTRAADQAGVVVKTSEGVATITRHSSETSSTRFIITTESSEVYETHSVVLATGGSRLSAGARLATALGHHLIPPVPSIFAFDIDDPRISPLPGISLSNVQVSAPEFNLQSTGPILITHRGLSGPSILQLSSWGARLIHDKNAPFDILINWLPDTDPISVFNQCRQSWGKRKVVGNAPFASFADQTVFPKRLWQTLCQSAGVEPDTTWSQIDKSTLQRLSSEISSGRFQVLGKSINKEEFVTCGGVPLREVNLRTMESRLCPHLYFAGELLDIDGITGGFNFQNAWTTGYLAGSSAAETSEDR